jgi:hypothetical protein
VTHAYTVTTIPINVPKLPNRDFIFHLDLQLRQILSSYGGALTSVINYNTQVILIHNALP